MPAFSRFLRYFVVVARLGSIRKAADELNIAASAIDRQILNVEAQLDLKLFERRSSGLRLTAAGEILMASGLRWQKSLTDTLSQMEDLRGLKRGHVEIAIIDALTKSFVPQLLSTISDRYPGITVGVRVLENDDVREAIIDGNVDFGIMLDPQTDRDLTVRAFVEVVLGFLCKTGDPLGEMRSARFSACANRDLLVPSEPLAIASQVAMLEAATGVSARHRFVSDNIQMITSLATEGLGIAILSSIDAISEVDAGLLSFTTISDPMLRPINLALCANSARTLSFAAGILIGEFESKFSKLDINNS